MITTGPDGALWFINTAGTIGRVDPASHQITQYPTSSQSNQFFSIATGSDGARWFTHGENIDQFNLSTHAITPYTVPALAVSGFGQVQGEPNHITTGPDGALWFTEGVGLIGRIDPVSHAITQYPVPGLTLTSLASPHGITSGPDGDLWFTEPQVHRIAKIDPNSDEITSYCLNTVIDAYEITAGSDGALWFTDEGGAIGRIDPTTDTITSYTLPATEPENPDSPYNPDTTEITSGPDGALWFTDPSNSLIGRIDPTSHEFNLFSLRDGSKDPTGITSGPDGALWFTEPSGENIGRLSFDAPPPIPPLDDPGSDSPEDLAPIAIDPVMTASTNTDDSISDAQVRYFDGVVQLDTTDLQSFGFGTPWGQSRSWTNGPGYASGADNGSGMVDLNLPYLVPVFNVSFESTIAVVLSGTNALYFDGSDGGYSERFGGKDMLNGNPYSGLTLVDTAGDTLVFYGFDSSLPAAEQGQLRSFTDASGNVTDLSSRTSDGAVAEVTRSSTTGSTTVTESFLFNYIDSGGVKIQGLISGAHSCACRQTNGGSWSTVRQVVYDYYDGTDSNGDAGDLDTAKIEDAAGNLIDEDYYRYYTPGDPNGYTHGLKYFFSATSFARLAAAVPDPLTASDSEVAPYADDYFEYDAQQRVTKAIVQGAGSSGADGDLGTFTYSYTTSDNPAGPNSWAVKTTETLPDGNQNIVFSNSSGQLMLEVFVDAHDPANPALQGDQWITFNKYSDQGQIIETAQPSAVTGYDEDAPDLLDFEDGSSSYLADSSGVIDIDDYYSESSATAGDTSAGGVTAYLHD